MKKLNLPIISDSILSGLCGFLLIFTAVRYYTKNLQLALALGIVAALLLAFLAFVYIRKRQGKKLLSARDERGKKLLSVHLAVCPICETQSIFLKLLDCKLTGKELVSEDKIYFLRFRLSPLSQDDIVGVIKNKSALQKIILCNEIQADAQKLADNFLIEIVTLATLYPELKDKNLLPEKYIFEGSNKPQLKARIKATFKKSRARPLFWCGLSFLFLSYFTFFPAYYIVAGGTLLIAGLVFRLFGG
jgi:hypothetical protein